MTLERQTKSIIEKEFEMETYKMVVNYDRSIVDLLNIGHYRCNDLITDVKFPSSEGGEREVEFGLFRTNLNLQSYEVFAEMEKSGFRPATVKELLSYGEKNSENKGLIVGFGSVYEINGYRYVCNIILHGSDHEAGLSLHCDLGWGAGVIFLGVRI